MRRGLAILLFIYSGFALGYEVDNFSLRYEPLKDSRSVLNTVVNENLKTSLAEFYKANKGCDKDRLFLAMRTTMSGWIVGSLESWAADTDKIEKHPAPNPSIYSKRSANDKVSGFVLTLAGLEPSINLHGQYIGVDKLGHFFDQGSEYYEVYAKHGKNKLATAKALDYGISLEKGFYGLATTGIKSHADLAANYSGFQFWQNLTEGPNPYFKCVNNKWQQSRPFDWAEYVNPGWDEAINCSTYDKPTMAKNVLARQFDLEDSAGKKNKNHHFVCPVSKNACVKLQSHYIDFAEKILSPECQLAVSSENLEPISGQTPGFAGNKSTGGGTTKRGTE